ncbi:MAG: hypothetical protein HGB36_13375 [Chlorobiaceae bacterium]|nr:hypothetical protein [Chlorobiaceae bacterium]
MNIRFLWYQVFVAVFFSGVITSGELVAVNRNLLPAKTGISYNPAQSFSFSGSDRMQHRLKPETRLNLEKQFVAQHLGLNADLVGIGDRKTLDLTAYELGDGYKVKLDFRGINLVYGTGIYSMPAETSATGNQGNVHGVQLFQSATPMDITLSFKPGVQQRRMFLISLEGLFAHQPVIFSSVTSYPGKIELSKNRPLSFSGQNTLGHIVIDEPPVTAEYLEIAIHAESFIFLQTIDITAVN